ncbi:MAG: carbohydrate kinase family protein [Patescibacteria group bacterium]|jgi:adenosine kinase
MTKILVSGSLAYDRIMDFPGRFRDHILPGKIHILNVCFVINKLRESFGGTAGNIAYNLALLGERPVVLGVVGEDFPKYEKWLRQNQIDISRVKKVKNEFTASAYIMTDRDDNQITGFYGGATDVKYCQVVKEIKGASLAIISPDYLPRMLEYAKLYRQLKIPYIFDPGQQITAFTALDLKQSIAGAKVLVGNDYEIQLILNRLKIKLPQLAKIVEILIVTKGANGDEIFSAGKKLIIPPAKPKNTSDPTGAGDAFRAGFIKGMLAGYSLAKAARLGNTVAVYTVEKYGTQTHRFTLAELQKRYYQNYKEKL